MNHHVAAAASAAARLNPMHEGLTGVLPQHLPMYLIIAGCVMLGLLLVVHNLLPDLIYRCSESGIVMKARGGVFLCIGLLLLMAGLVMNVAGTYPAPNRPSAIQSSLESAYKVKIKDDGGIFKDAAKDNRGIGSADVRFTTADGVPHDGRLSRKGMDFTLYVKDGKGAVVPYERNGSTKVAPSTAVRLNPMHKGMTGVLPQHLPEYLLIGAIAMGAICFLILPIILAIINRTFDGSALVERIVMSVPDSAGTAIRTFLPIACIMLGISGFVLTGVGTYPAPNDPAAIQSSLESAYKVKIDGGTGIFKDAAKDNGGTGAADVRFTAADGVNHNGRITRSGMDFTLYVKDGKGGIAPYGQSSPAPVANPTGAAGRGGGKTTVGTE